MSAGLCHPVCVRALVRGVRALVRVVYIPPVASICKHLRPVCVSNVCQVRVECVSSGNNVYLCVNTGVSIVYLCVSSLCQVVIMVYLLCIYSV